MSIENLNLGDGELEIMKVIWASGKEMGTGEISEKVKDKNWKRTTISTFLSRLVEKGALAVEKKGNNYYYTALVSKKKYSLQRTNSLISTLFDGSAKQLCASLFEDGNLTESDIAELRAIFAKEEENA